MRLCLECERPAFAVGGALCAACEETKSERLAGERLCSAEGCGEVLHPRNTTGLCQHHRKLVWARAHKHGACLDCGKQIKRQAKRCHLHAARHRWGKKGGSHETLRAV